MAFAMASSACIADTTALRRGPRRAAKRVSRVVRALNAKKKKKTSPIQNPGLFFPPLLFVPT